MGHDHDVLGRRPPIARKGPVQAPLLVVALEEHQVSPGAQLIQEVGLGVTEAPVDRVWFDHGGEVPNGIEQLQETLIGVAYSPGVHILIQTVLVLQMNHVRLELFYQLRHRLPPVASV